MILMLFAVAKTDCQNQFPEYLVFQILSKGNESPVEIKMQLEKSKGVIKVEQRKQNYGNSNSRKLHIKSAVVYHLQICLEHFSIYGKTL